MSKDIERIDRKISLINEHLSGISDDVSAEAYREVGSDLEIHGVVSTALDSELRVDD